jgi:hypothetical protein
MLLQAGQCPPFRIAINESCMVESFSCTTALKDVVNSVVFAGGIEYVRNSNELHFHPISGVMSPASPAAGETTRRSFHASLRNGE